MPNTLAHIGIQTLLTRGLLREADIKWVWAGCLLPDLPWIGRRFLGALIDQPIDLRLYAIVQSALLFALIFSGLLACFSRTPGRTFAILAGGSLLHLLLDALQTKWANGVVLFAPLRWDLWNFGLFWPEDLTTLLLTLLGLLVALYGFWRWPKLGGDLIWPRGLRLGAALALALLYLAGPLPLVSAAERANLHHTQTLRPESARGGRAIGFDRNRVTFEEGAPQITAWTRERFALTGSEAPQAPGLVSIQGRFRDDETIEVTALHRHTEGLRDYTTYLGIALIALWWGLCLWRRRGSP